jgi:DNA repair protein RadD
MELRAYQIDAVGRLRTLIAGLPKDQRWCILQAATGAGKTVMAAEIIRSCSQKGKRCLFLAPSRELIQQCSEKLNRFDVEHGIIMAGYGYNLDKLVQVASKDTLLSRAVRMPQRRELAMKAVAEGGLTMPQTAHAHRTIARLGEMSIDLPPFDLVIPDECHLSLAPTWSFLLKLWPDAVVIGLTATPARTDGRGLGTVYKGMVQAVPSSQLIAEGFLVPTRVFAPYRPDLKGVPCNVNGEYAKAPLQKRMDQPKLVGDIVDHWKRLANGRQTIAFASGVEHSIHIRDQFRAGGITAEHLDGNTDPDERQAILNRLASGQISVLANCNVLTQGWDCPSASCCILAKPTKSYVAFRQMAGRIQRPYPGKADALLIDHAGCVYLHGLPDADVDWVLKDGEKIQDKVKPKPGNPGVVHCPKCHAMFTGGVCPACGHKAKEATGNKVEAQNGQLVEVNGVSVQQKQEAAVRLWHKHLAIAANRGWPARQAAAMFARDHGCPPWEVPNLPNMPQRHQWQTPVVELFPQYVRGRKDR